MSFSSLPGTVFWALYSAARPIVVHRAFRTKRRRTYCATTFVRCPHKKIAQEKNRVGTKSSTHVKRSGRNPQRKWTTNGSFWSAVLSFAFFSRLSIVARFPLSLPASLSLFFFLFEHAHIPMQCARSASSEPPCMNGESAVGLHLGTVLGDPLHDRNLVLFQGTDQLVQMHAGLLLYVVRRHPAPCHVGVSPVPC